MFIELIKSLQRRVLKLEKRVAFQTESLKRIENGEFTVISAVPVFSRN
jgi:hypothetical protein